MTDTVTPDAADSAEESAPVAVEIQVGRQLENARKALQISVSDMAQRLRLGEKQVLALETGDLAALPGKTFVRGFVRNYARAAQIDPDPLMSLLDSANELPTPKLELPESTHVAMPEQGRGINRDLLTVIAGLALVAIAAALYFFLPEQWAEPISDSEQNTQPEVNPPFLEEVETPSEDAAGVVSNAETATPTPAAKANSANAANSTTPAAPAPQQTAPKPTAPSVAPATSSAPTTEPTAAATARVHLDFSDTSWVEVRDKNGKTLSSGQHPAGTQHEVSGAPPLTVIVGRASGVRLRYQGQPVTLRPSADSDIARVVLP